MAALLVLTGCGSKGSKGQDVKIGTAMTVSAKSTDVSDEEGKFETNIYYATVVLKDDKFVQVQIDVAQNTQKVNVDGTLAEFKFPGSKKVQEDSYGMKEYGNAVQEWYKQIADLEDYMVGQTLSEVLAMETVKKDDAHPAVPAVADLTSKVTISVQDYLKVVEAATNAAVEVKGVKSVGNTSFTTAGDGKDGKLELTTTVGATAFDSNDKVVYSFIDSAQVYAQLTDGKIAVSEDLRTKGEKKEDYGMKKAGSEKEWYEQVNAFREWAQGKTASEVDKATEADLNSVASIYPTALQSSITVSFQKAVELK